MRANPVHPNPSVYPAPLPGGHRPAVAGAHVPPHAAQPGSVQALGDDVPQVVVDYAAAGHIKAQVSKQLTDALKSSPSMGVATQRQLCRAWINDAVAIWADAKAAERGVDTTQVEDAALAAAVYDMLFRAGRLQPHLDNPRVENIFINGRQTFLDFGDGRRVAVPPVADSEEELLELLRDLARRSGQSERTLSTKNPFLALQMPDGSRLQVITGAVGHQTYVTIRRHRVRDADLDDLVKLGTIDSTLREFLAGCVRAEKNVMIVGPQEVGKTSLMRAMLKEIPPEERFATVETEFELFAHTGGFHRQVVALQARESNGERGPDGHAAGEVTLLDLIHKALRMTVSRIVVGEVRGPEILAMMQALTNGMGGNLCTLHARAPQVVFDRIAELYLLAQSNMSEDLAYRQTANGLDFVVYLSMTNETRIGGRKHRYVSHVLEVLPVGSSGRPQTNEVFRPGREFGEVRAVPGVYPQCLDDLRRVGFPAHLLDEPGGTWDAPLDLLVRP